MLNQEYFAIELADSVRLALPLEDLETLTRFEQHQICPIPGVSPYWIGVVNQQGSLLWVLDSRQFFELKATAPINRQKRTVAVLKRLVGGTWRRVALAIERLEGMADLSLAQTLEMNPVLKACHHSLFTTTVNHSDRPLTILNTEKLFQAIRH